MDIRTPVRVQLGCGFRRVQTTQALWGTRQPTPAGAPEFFQLRAGINDRGVCSKAIERPRYGGDHASRVVCALRHRLSGRCQRRRPEIFAARSRFFLLAAMNGTLAEMSGTPPDPAPDTSCCRDHHARNSKRTRAQHMERKRSAVGSDDAPSSPARSAVRMSARCSPFISGMTSARAVHRRLRALLTRCAGAAKAARFLAASRRGQRTRASPPAGTQASPRSPCPP